MADLLSGQITFTGLGSGTDFNTVVDKLVEIEGAQRDKLASWKTEWENKVLAIQELNNTLISLKTTLGKMNTLDEFMTKSVSISDSTVLSATASASAQAQTHTIEVNQMAQNKIMVTTAGYSAEDANIASGGAAVFAYAYEGSTYSVNVAQDTTLEELAASINDAADNPGVRASIISDGTDYYLQLRGLDLGADATLTIDGSTTLTGFGASDFETTQANQNAQIRVNGWPSASWIESESNTITQAIEGITLNLKSLGSAPPTSVTLTVGLDNAGMKENVVTFVEQINEVRVLIQDLTKYDDVREEASIMTGNYAFQLVASRFKTATADAATGFAYYDESNPNNTDLYSSLSQVGILTDAETGSATAGQLIIDEAKLNEALANDPQAVADLFAAYYEGTQTTTGSANFSYYSHISTITQAGSYDVSYTVSGGVITSATIDGQTASIDGNLVTAMADGPAQGLQFKVNDMTDGTYSGEVRLKLGKVGQMEELLKDLTSAEDGPLTILEDNYEGIVDNIEKKIEQEQTRLDLYAYNMRMKFARLEAVLAQYNGIQSSLDSAIAQLPD